MAAKLNCLKTNDTGFTLLELLIALAIGSIVMFATYTLVTDTFRYHKISTARSQQLLEMIQIKRLLHNDFMAILPENFESPSLSGEEDSLSLRCEGSVVWDMQLGPEVVVHYSLPQQTKQNLFSRKVSGTSGKKLPIYDISIKGLKEVQYEVLDQTGWKTLQDADSPIVAMRLTFVWHDIGTWEIILPIERQNIGISTS